MIGLSASSLTDVLFRGRNGDGGWVGLLPREFDRIEPICWA